MLITVLIAILVFVVIAAAVKYLLGSKNYEADFIKAYVVLMLTLIFIGPIFFLYLGTKEKYTDLFIKSVSISTIIFFGSILILIAASFIYNYFKRKRINEHS